MKLSAQYNRVNFATSLIVLLFTGISYYMVIHFILTDRLDKDLEIEEDEIVEYVNSYGKLPLPVDYKDQKVEYSLLKDGRQIRRRFVNTEYKSLTDKEMEPGRSLVTNVNSNDKIYQVTITKSRVESEDLVRIICLITLAITAVLLIAIMLIHRFMLSRLWKPFYTVLEQMKAFNIADKNEINPDTTQIDEFAELNKAAMSLSQRVKQDYKDLKSFTDNASHEMMTPLAVINSKLDTLLQVEPLSNRQGEIIDEIYNAAGRLSRLNQSLLLLAKIENNLIKEQETVDLKNLIDEKLRQFQELIQSNHISVTSILNGKGALMSKYLADILLNNLISNSIRHNHEKGEIEILLDASHFSITNTGAEQELDIEKVFERFNKSTASEGIGLGLAISKQICSLNKFSLQYSYHAGKHTFSIIFNPSTDFLQT